MHQNAYEKLQNPDQILYIYIYIYVEEPQHARTVVFCCIRLPLATVLAQAWLSTVFVGTSRNRRLTLDYTPFRGKVLPYNQWSNHEWTIGCPEGN